MCRDPVTGETVMQDRGGWIKLAGEGHVIYVQPGHSRQDLERDPLRQILLNCLTWEP